MIAARSFDRLTKRPARENGNAYSAPNATDRGLPLGVYRESFDCRNAGGERKDPDDQLATPAPLKAAGRKPPCFVQPRSLFNGKQFNKLRQGRGAGAQGADGPRGQRARRPEPALTATARGEVSA